MDKDKYQKMMMDLYDKKLVSARALITAFDVDYDQMIEDIREYSDNTPKRVYLREYETSE